MIFDGILIGMASQVLLRGVVLSLAGLALSGSVSPIADPEPPLSDRIQLVLRARVPAEGKPPELRAGGEPFRAAAGLSCFYQGRGFVPAWSNEGGLFPENAEEMLAALRISADDGLRPEDYHLADLERRVAAAKARLDPVDLAELDLLLTDAFLNLASDLRYGRVNPRTAGGCAPPEPGKEPPPEESLAARLETALEERQVRSSLESLVPQSEGYRTLRLALAFHRGIVARGGWPTVPEGPTLRPGERGERTAALRARLEASGFLAPAAADRDLFDPSLEAAVRAFQERNGLEPDAAVGKGTLALLNVPAGDRLRQIEINLERWRWLPRDLGQRYIMVNIAGFYLDVVEDGRSALAMKVVVGKPYTKTPMFSGIMTYLVVNPSWGVPQSIVSNEIVPRMRRDPGFLARNGYEVSVGRGSPAADPASIDWANASGSGLAIRQKPGRGNSLGRFKFMFPNQFNVYLHDTPTDSLFARATRSFSHGCVRLEQPEKLAQYVLADQPSWTTERIEQAMRAGQETTVTLSGALPVYLGYWTARVSADGILQFRTDLYGIDGRQSTLLSATLDKLKARAAAAGAAAQVRPAKPVPGPRG
jgi:L,D-transpeptidase YcbB